MRLIFLMSTGAILACLSLSFFWIDWRPESPQFGVHPKVKPQASPGEVEDLCGQAQMAVENVKAKDRCEDIYRKLLKDFGQPMAATLEKACIDGRLIVEDNLVFFPAKSLCARKDLPSRCSSLCNRWRSKNEK